MFKSDSLTSKEAQYITNKFAKIYITKGREKFEEIFKAFVKIAYSSDGQINLNDLGHISIYVKEAQQESCADLLIANLRSEEINQLIASMIHFELAKETREKKAGYMQEDSLLTKLMQREKDVVFPHNYDFFTAFIYPHIENVIKIINDNYSAFNKDNWSEEICCLLIEILENFLATAFDPETLKGLPFTIRMNTMTLWQESKKLVLPENKRVNLLAGYIILRIINPSITAFVEGNKEEYGENFLVYQANISRIFMRPIQQLTNSIGHTFVNQQGNKKNPIWEKLLSEKIFIPKHTERIKAYLIAVTKSSIEIPDHQEDNESKEKSPRKFYYSEKDAEKAEQIIAKARTKENSNRAVEKKPSTPTNKGFMGTKKNAMHAEEKEEIKHKTKHSERPKHHTKKKLTNSTTPTDFNSDKLKKHHKKKISSDSPRLPVKSNSDKLKKRRKKKKTLNSSSPSVNLNSDKPKKSPKEKFLHTFHSPTGHRKKKKIPPTSQSLPTDSKWKDKKCPTPPPPLISSNSFSSFSPPEKPELPNVSQVQVPLSTRNVVTRDRSASVDVSSLTRHESRISVFKAFFERQADTPQEKSDKKRKSPTKPEAEKPKQLSISLKPGNLGK